MVSRLKTYGFLRLNSFLFYSPAASYGASRLYSLRGSLSKQNITEKQGFNTTVAAAIIQFRQSLNKAFLFLVDLCFLQAGTLRNFQIFTGRCLLLPKNEAFASARTKLPCNVALACKRLRLWQSKKKKQKSPRERHLPQMEKTQTRGNIHLQLSFCT